MKKKKLFGLLLAPAALTLFLAGCSDKESRVVGTVNGAEITEGELNKALTVKYGQEVLEELMTNEIIRQEAKKERISVSDEDLKAEYDIYAGYYGGEEKLLESLSSYNTTKEDILNDIEIYLLTVRLMEKTITITDEDVEAYYEETKDQYLTDEDEQMPFDDVKDDVKQALLAAKVDEGYEDWVNEKFETNDVRSYLFENKK